MKSQRNKLILTQTETKKARIVIIVKAGPWFSEVRLKATDIDKKDFNGLMRITRKYS